MHDFRYLVYLLEAVGAISGLYYYKKNPTDKSVGFFAYFLLVTYLVETIGWIPTIIYRWEELHFLKNGFWYKNFWLYNPYILLSFICYIYYFSKNIKNRKAVKQINRFLILYTVICILNFILTEVFFTTTSIVTYVLGSIFLVGVIFYYYFEVLLSSKILYIKREISFYISFVALLNFLCTAPIMIYFKYFTEKSPGFVELSTWVLVGINIFMYSSYSIAFLWLANKKKPSTKNLKNAN
jgi:hypothetical protein